MRLLFFPIAFVRELLASNPFKTVFVVLGIIFYSYAGKLPQVRNEATFYHQLELNGKWVGIYGDDFETMVFDSKPKLINGKTYVYYNYHPGNAFLYFGLVLVVIFVVVGSFVNDGWELNYVFGSSVSIFVRCDIEDGVYVYTIFGRLLAKYTTQCDTTIFNDLRRVTRILGLPKYETRMSKRERLLRKLGL